MKNRKIAGLLALVSILVVSLFTACYSPSPLYGTWSDNIGNSIVFNTDGTYTAKLKQGGGGEITHQGSYTVIENVIVFQKSAGQINSEWDIRGQMMYLTWTDSGNTVALTLYHVAK
ncbi:MAG: hypothetical protein MJ169_05035 [Treponema sp.]|nr:hypothetical protein [Treponema sp.]